MNKHNHDDKRYGSARKGEKTRIESMKTSSPKSIRAELESYFLPSDQAPVRKISREDAIATPFMASGTTRSRLSRL